MRENPGIMGRFVRSRSILDMATVEWIRKELPDAEDHGEGEG
jgi:hypothetical protein